MTNIVHSGRRRLEAAIRKKVWDDLLGQHRDELARRDFIGRLLMKARLRPLVDWQVAVELRRISEKSLH